ILGGKYTALPLDPIRLVRSCWLFPGGRPGAERAHIRGRVWPAVVRRAAQTMGGHARLAARVSCRFIAFPRVVRDLAKRSTRRIVGRVWGGGGRRGKFDFWIGAGLCAGNPWCAHPPRGTATDRRHGLLNRRGRLALAATIGAGVLSSDRRFGRGRDPLWT